MQQILPGGLIAFMITFLAIPVIIAIARKKKLYDEPDDKRKFHKRPIPYLGGLGMFVGFSLSILVTIDFAAGAPEFQYYFAGFLFIFFLGIKDDILVLSASKKFAGQIMVACLLMYKAHLVIDNLEGLFGVFALNPVCSYSLTLVSIVAIINAFNLIDGIDGLAGGLGLTACMVFGIFFLANNDIPYAVLAFAFAGSLFGFLYYNMFPAKIFMGDTGALMVGLVCSILVIRFIQEGSTYAYYPVSASPAVGFAVLILPLMDTLRVFLIRVIQGRSPFSPDRNHIHHLFLRIGINPKIATISCVLYTIFTSIAAFAFQGIGPTLLLAGLVMLFLCLVYLLHFGSRNELRVIKGQVNPVVANRSEIVVAFFDNKRAVVKED